MAGGWARDGAVQDQIDASVEDAVELQHDAGLNGLNRRASKDSQLR